MKYLNNKFYTEVNNPKYIINDGQILRETTEPKSLKTKYEHLNGVKLDKNLNVVELVDGKKTNDASSTRKSAKSKLSWQQGV